MGWRRSAFTPRCARASASVTASGSLRSRSAATAAISSPPTTPSRSKARSGPRSRRARSPFSWPETFSAAHAAAGGIEQRLALASCRTPLADELDLEALLRGLERSRNVAKGDRATDPVTVSARSDPTNDTSVVPDGLIARRVGIGGIDAEGREPQRATAFFLLESRGTPDEVSLGEIHEAAEPRLMRAVDRAVLARPGTEALLDAHRIERAAPEEPQPLLPSGRAQQIVECALVFTRHPDLVAELAGEADTADECRDHADIHLPEGEEWKCAAREIAAGEALQQLARVGARY